MKRPFPHPKTVDPEALQREANACHKRYRFTMILTFLFCALMFVEIGITVLLTGARDIPEFTSRDYIIFYLFIATELITVVVTFTFAIVCGRSYRAEIWTYKLIALCHCYKALFQALPEGEVRVFSALGDGHPIRGVTFWEDGSYAFSLQHFLCHTPILPPHTTVPYSADCYPCFFTPYDRKNGFSTMEEAAHALTESCVLPLEEEFP